MLTEEPAGRGWPDSSPPPRRPDGAGVTRPGAAGTATHTPLLIDGAMTLGASTDATDDAVQANFVAAGYGH